MGCQEADSEGGLGGFCQRPVKLVSTCNQRWPEASAYDFLKLRKVFLRRR